MIGRWRLIVYRIWTCLTAFFVSFRPSLGCSTIEHMHVLWRRFFQKLVRAYPRCSLDFKATSNFYNRFCNSTVLNHRPIALVVLSLLDLSNTTRFDFMLAGGRKAGRAYTTLWISGGGPRSIYDTEKRWYLQVFRMTCARNTTRLHQSLVSTKNRRSVVHV
jgi:hypothetical protein